LLLGCSHQPEPRNILSGKVTRVVSGQTVEVMLANTSKAVKVRIIGIDAPDLRQDPWGEAAKKRLTELVMAMPVEIELEPEGDKPTDTLRDRFNRLPAHLWQNKVLVGKQLIEEGCVLADDRYDHSYSKLMQESQEYARALGYGIWNPDRAMRYTPSQFRSMNK
jgi:micrococcal nuclease